MTAGKQAEEISSMKRDISELKEGFRVMMAKIDEVLKSNTAEFSGVKRHIDDVSADLVSEIGKISGKVEEAVKSINNHEKRLSTIEEKYKADDERMRRIEERQIDDQARMRRNNLIFFGLPEEAGEREDNCKKKINDLIAPFFPERKPVLQRAHRLGGIRIGQNVKPRGVIVLFQEVKKNRATLQRAGVLVKDDLPQEIRDARRQLSKDLERHRAAGDDAFVAFPARLFVNGRCVRTVRPVAGRPPRTASPVGATGGGAPPPVPPPNSTA